MRALLIRGLAAGMLAGLASGLVGLVAGEPSLEAAIAVEESIATESQAESHGGETPPAGDWMFTRDQQRSGLVAGTILVGAAVGTLLAVALAWSDGRIAGDAWTRGVKLAAVVVGAVVVLPAIKYPSNPPGIGDPATLGTRTTLYLGLGALGLLLAVAAWTAARQLASTRLSRPARQALVGAGTAVAAALMIAGLPAAPLIDSAGMPAELLWSFRLGSLATQATLYGGAAILLGLLSSKAERESASSRRG